jgi:aspartate-semialdehyde dehydrogenase
VSRSKNASVSIVGSETVIGRELRERLVESGLAREVQLIGAEDEISGIITEVDGEPVVMTPLDADRLNASDIVFCAGSAASTRKALSLIGSARRPCLVDLSYALEEEPDARLRAPYIELGQAPSGVAASDAIHVLAHPAAVAVAVLLTRLHSKFPVQHSVIQILEPASERGQAGMNELQQQSTGLLSFQTLNKAVFDAQAGFNILPRYGEDAPERLQDIEARIERHTASLLGVYGVPIPSVRLIQAPVFHGYSMSFWIEFESRPSATEFGEALASTYIEIRDADLEPPTNVGAVGQEGITAGLIEPDRNHSRAMWVWVTADNFRLLVDNAIAVTRELEGRENS